MAIEAGRNCFSYLRNFKGMSEAIPKKVGLYAGEKLCLALQSPECGAMQHPSVITPEVAPVRRRFADRQFSSVVRWNIQIDQTYLPSLGVGGFPLTGLFGFASAFRPMYLLSGSSSLATIAAAI